MVVLLHELGHALSARPGGYRVTSFGIGLGPPLWSMPLRDGVVVHVDRWILAGGACTAIPAGPPTSRRAWFHAGGLIAQGLLACALLLAPAHWLIDRISAFNLLVAVTNALPWRFGGQASDGWYLLDAFRGGRRSGNVLQQVSALERMADREGAIGSHLGRAYSEVCLAWAEVLAGRPDRAASLFIEDPPSTALEPWVDALYRYVRAEWLRSTGHLDEAIACARGAGAGHVAGRAITRLAEARALVDAGHTAEAHRVLAHVGGAGGAIGQQAAAVLLHASLGESAEDVEHAAWRVLRSDGAWLDPVDAAVALRLAGDALESAGRLDAAGGARVGAAELARATLASADTLVAEDLAARLAPLLTIGRSFRVQPDAQ
ncbi:MAG: hypothetical protein ACI8PZ_003967 [Myxococcota bacterium]|jgi:hypothetical protein